MKKLLVLTLTALTITILVGCGAKNNNVQKENNEPMQQEQNESAFLLGKVEKVVGNEISMKLTDDNFQGMTGRGNNSSLESFELTDEQQKILENGGTVELEGGSVSIGVSTVGEDDIEPGIESFESEADDTQFTTSVEWETGSEGALFSEMEFNGEVKDLIIPAGVDIFNMTAGKQGKMSDIKEGSILSIVMDSKTNTVARIEIIG